MTIDYVTCGESAGLGDRAALLTWQMSMVSGRRVGGWLHRQKYARPFATLRGSTSYKFGCGADDRRGGSGRNSYGFRLKLPVVSHVPMCYATFRMRKRFNYLKVIVAGWAMLSVLISGTSGMVLCIGEDGHIAIEPAHHDTCHNTCETGNKHRTPEPLIKEHAGEYDCNSCIDLALSLDHALHITAPSTTSRSITRTLKNATSTTLIYPLKTAETSIQRLASGMTARPSPHLSVQRVTILRA